MKALSIKQPWLQFILNGWKTLEIRTWNTTYRGPLLLVSSKTHDKEWPFKLSPSGSLSVFDVGPFVYGHALCTVNLVDCRPMVETDEKDAMCHWSPPLRLHGPNKPGARAKYERLYAWKFADVTPITPFPVKGKLNIFEVDTDE